MGADRMRKVNELVRTHVSQIISKDIELPLDVFVTITKVDTAKNLRDANVYVTVLPDGKRITAMKALQKAHGYIQKLLGQQVKLKFTPRLHFKLDEGELKAQHVRDVMDSTGQ